MNVLFEIFLDNSILLDIFGIIGLGLVGLAAIRLTQRAPTAGASFMLWGVLSVIIGRLLSMGLSLGLSSGFFRGVESSLMPLLQLTPTVLLTLGLASIVWGFWDHERQAAARPALID